VLDLSLTMVTVGREHVSGSAGQAARVHYGVADVAALPFQDHTFDTVLCVGVLQYLPAPAVALRELARVTRDGGQVMVTFPNAQSPLNALHGAAVAGARRGRALLQWMGVVVQPDESRLTFRDDIPNTPLAVQHLEAVARGEGLHVGGVTYHSLHFPFAIPGCHRLLRTWDRLANRALSAGWFTTWGREAIVRLTR
jgi:SAM-dependent methyltransferase